MYSNDMEYHQTRYYEHNRRLFTLIGVWPYQESSIRLRRACFVTSIMTVLLILQTHLLFVSGLNMIVITDLMQTYLPSTCFICCYVNLLYNSEALKLLLDRLQSDPGKLRNREESELLQRYAKQSKLCSVFMICMFYLYVGLWIFPSLRSLCLQFSDISNDTKFVLPLRVEYCLKNRIRYFSMLLFQCIGIFIISTVGIAHYSMVISCVQHACALFAIVSMKIDRPFKIDTDDYGWTVLGTKSGNENNWIIAVIKYYNDAIKFVELLRGVFGATYFIELILVMLFIIIDFFYVFQLLDSALSMSETIRNCIFITASLAIIYAVFYVAQRLIDHSVNVYEKCCQIPFYALSLKTQKYLLLLIMRSLKPCNFNVSGIMVTSHEVFAKIANTSYSFAIVFHNMR